MIICLAAKSIICISQIYPVIIENIHDSILLQCKIKPENQEITKNFYMQNCLQWKIMNWITNKYYSEVVTA